MKIKDIFPESFGQNHGWALCTGIHCIWQKYGNRHQIYNSKLHLKDLAAFELIY